MIKIRNNLFETNSSSTHSLTMCKEEEYLKWKDGEIYFCDPKGFMTKEEVIRYIERTCWRDEEAKPLESLSEHEFEVIIEPYGVYTYNTYGEDLERFWDKYTTSSGETIVAFGCFGYDG